MFLPSIGIIDVNIGSKITQKRRGLRDWGIEIRLVGCIGVKRYFNS